MRERERTRERVDRCLCECRCVSSVAVKHFVLQPNAENRALYKKGSFCCCWGVCFVLHITVMITLFLYYSPEGSLGMSDVSFLSGISGLSFDSPFLSPLLFFCLVLLLFLSCHFSANGPFS